MTKIESARSGVSLFLAPIGVKVVDHLYLNERGEHGFFMIGLAKHTDTPAEILEVNAAATAIAEKVYAGTEWIAKTEKLLSGVRIPGEEGIALAQRLEANKAKLGEMIEQLDAMEDRLVKIIRDYIAAQPNQEMLIQREGPGFSESDRVIFSLRNKQNAPYPVWTPADIALLLRVSAVFGDGFKNDTEPATAEEFVLRYGDVDPIESARQTAGEVIEVKRQNAKQRAQERKQLQKALKTSDAETKELSAGLIGAEKPQGTGFGKL
jgi:hypothetical protein